MGDWDEYAVQQAGNMLQLGMQGQQNKRAFKRSAEFTREMFDKTNEYNHPVQQMARLKKAGLNPALMYGKSGGTGVATQPAGQKMDAAQVPDLNAGLGYAELQLIKSNIKNNESTSNLNTLKGATEAQNAALVKEQTGKTEAEKISAQETAKLAEDLTKASLEAQTIDIESKRSGVTESKARTNKLKEETKTISATRELTVDQFKSTIAKLNKELDVMDVNINLTKAQSDNAYAQSQLAKIKTAREDYKASQDAKGLPVDASLIGNLNAVVGYLMNLIN